LPGDVLDMLETQVEKEASKDVLSQTARIGQLAAVPFTVAFIWFFAEHQSLFTGFLTD